MYVSREGGKRAQEASFGCLQTVDVIGHRHICFAPAQIQDTIMQNRYRGIYNFTGEKMYHELLCQLKNPLSSKVLLLTPWRRIYAEVCSISSQEPHRLHTHGFFKKTRSSQDIYQPFLSPHLELELESWGNSRRLERRGCLIIVLSVRSL